MVTLFNDISILVGYLVPKLSLQKESSCIIWPIAWENKDVNTFQKGICPKVNVIVNVPSSVVYKEGHADSLLVYERTYEC